MGQTQTNALDAKSTALDVIQHYGVGKYLDGKTAVVTGGNSGIGLETCKGISSKQDIT